MPAIAEPNIGINWNWTLGEDGWKAGMDFNMIVLGWLAQGIITVAAKSVTAQPGSPANGEAHILAATHSGTDWGAWAENDLVLYISGYPTDHGWIRLTPLEGWMVSDRALNCRWYFSGTVWIKVPLDPPVRIETGAAYEAELDDETIVLDNAVMSFNFPDEATVPFRVGKRLTVANQNAAAATITDDAAITWVGTDPTGGTLAQGDNIQAQKIAPDVWLRLN